MSNDAFPRMMTVRQKFPRTPPLDIPATVQVEFEKIRSHIKPGSRIALAVGSRGISNLQTIVGAALDVLKTAGAQPFIVPAMGSHGGATPEGQKEILAEYGVSEQKLGVPIRAAMEVERIGATEDGVDVLFSAEALRADGIIVINRVKPHTDFISDSLGSGVLKMIVVGLGKQIGAANFHAAASRLGYERVIRSMAQVSLRTAPILCGVGAVENQFHDTARIEVWKRDEIQEGEAKLLAEAKQLMPRLPFDDIDLLILDRIGKNISGSGMDPNVTGRWARHDSSASGPRGPSTLVVRRIFVRDLTAETHGNAIGIGFADMTTARLVRAMDKQVTYMNALTAQSPNGAKIPIHFETDREAISAALRSIGQTTARQAKIVRIPDTLSLERLEVSEAYAELIKPRTDLESGREPAEMKFDSANNLIPLA